MELGLKNKKALVTGGAIGIGQAIALELVNEGANVVITSRNEDRLNIALQKMVMILKRLLNRVIQILQNQEAVVVNRKRFLHKSDTVMMIWKHCQRPTLGSDVVIQQPLVRLRRGMLC